MNVTRRYRLRRRCTAALRGVEIPRPWNLDTFLDRLSARRGRPIHLAEAPVLAGGGISAQWWKQRDRDLIFYAPTESVFYFEISVLHEVGHMLCAHDLDESDASPFAATVAAELANSRGAIATMFSRSSRCDTAMEEEAEYTAYRLKLMIERCGHVIGDTDSAAAQLRSAKRRTLGHAGE